MILRWLRPAQRLQDTRLAALARRIEQHGRRLRGETRKQRRQDLFCSTRDKLAVGPPTGRSIPTRGLDRQTVQFYADKRLDEVAEFDTEEPDPAIDIQQILRSALSQALAHDLHQSRQQEEVVSGRRNPVAPPSLAGEFAAPP